MVIDDDDGDFLVRAAAHQDRDLAIAKVMISRARAAQVVTRWRTRKAALFPTGLVLQFCRSAVQLVAVRYRS